MWKIWTFGEWFYAHDTEQNLLQLQVTFFVMFKISDTTLNFIVMVLNTFYVLSLNRGSDLNDVREILMDIHLSQ